jgi:putative membrane protein
VNPTLVRTAPIAAGTAVLALVWLGPLPGLSHHAFSAHMTMHMAVVALAAPLIAWGIAGGRLDPVPYAPWLFAPIPASMMELVIVSAWHTPALHQAARGHTAVFALEQATFLAAGLLLWLSAAGGMRGTEPWRAGAGVAALLFTSMHMTLLGALFALTPRPLYGHATNGLASLSPLSDQHLGGAIMLLVGGASYLAGGLWLTARMLKQGLGGNSSSSEPGNIPQTMTERRPH